VSVGGYVKSPCGFDDVIGAIEGDYQQESRVRPGDDREAPGSYLERYVDVSVFGVMSLGRFDRGVTVLPLVRSKAYVLAPDEIDAISSPDGDEGKGGFRIGALAGHGGVPVTVPADKLFASYIGVFGNTGSGKSNTLCKGRSSEVATTRDPAPT
jgi:DNA helicase HerA-like ATPase